MKYFIDKLDRAGLTLHQGFVTECFGRRGAVLFFVLFGGLVPMNSAVNGLWLSLWLLIFGVPSDFPISGNNLIYVISGLFLIGIFGIIYDIFKMSKREISTL